MKKSKKIVAITTAAMIASIGLCGCENKSEESLNNENRIEDHQIDTDYSNEARSHQDDETVAPQKEFTPDENIQPAVYGPPNVRSDISSPQIQDSFQ